MNWIKLLLIGLIMFGLLPLQACKAKDGHSLSLKDITDADMKAMTGKMKYVQIDGNCYSVVKYRTHGYDIAVHTYIPCEKVPNRYKR